MKISRGIMFLMKLLAESNGRYAGENVKYDQTETPVFWHKAADPETYRVIYGDLSAKEVSKEDLQK